MKINIIQKIVTTTLVLGSFTISFAQKIDEQAKKILDEVTQNYESKENTYFKFVFSSGNGKIAKNQSGIYYAAKDKYKLKIMGTEQIFDGKKIYNISADEKEVTIAKSDGKDAMFSPINYLDTYKKDYNVDYNGQKKINNVNANMIVLTPVKSNGLKTINLYVNAEKKQLVRLEQYSNNGDIAIINITNYKENQKLSPEMFSFNAKKYKNYLVTEL